jgi:SagB-type dehydrogenase family enzyme
MRVVLEEPNTGGPVSVEEAIMRRRSRRVFQRARLTKQQLSQVLWSAVKAPSAGATYPLAVYVVVGGDSVEGIDAGVYHYQSAEGALTLIKEGDQRRALAIASLRQMFIADAPASVVITAEYERTTRVYGDRGVRYVVMEAGHVSQNIYLQCEALELATVAIGAFHDDEVANVVNMPSRQRPLYVMPVGARAERS